MNPNKRGNFTVTRRKTGMTMAAASVIPVMALRVPGGWMHFALMHPIRECKLYNARIPPATLPPRENNTGLLVILFYALPPTADAINTPLHIFTTIGNETMPDIQPHCSERSKLDARIYSFGYSNAGCYYIILFTF